jgi:hypothetical protein
MKKLEEGVINRSSRRRDVSRCYGTKIYYTGDQSYRLTFTTAKVNVSCSIIYYKDSEYFGIATWS